MGDVCLSAVVLDERQHGVTLRSLAETPTGPMTMRGNIEAIIYWPRMTRKRGYWTALKYGRDADECIMAQVAVVYTSRIGKAFLAWAARGTRRPVSCCCISNRAVLTVGENKTAEGG